MAETGIELISKAPTLKDTGKFTKEDFQIDLEQSKVICPKLEEVSSGGSHLISSP